MHPARFAMKRRYDLTQLLRDYACQLNRFEKRFLEIIRRPTPLPQDKHEISYLTIELLNRYRNFNRAFLFSCTTGARTTKKTIVGLGGISDEFDFIGAVFSTYSKKQVDTSTRTWNSRDEPAWESDVLRIARNLRLQNEVAIETAFTVSSFYKPLKVFRNFCGHRSHELFKEVADAAVQYNLCEKSVERLLTTRSPSDGYLIIKWIDECRVYASLICE